MFTPIRLFLCISLCFLFNSPYFSCAQNSRKSDILNRFSKQSDAINYSRFDGQPSPSDKVLTLLGRQARWDDAGLGHLLSAGLRLHFEKIDEQVTQGGRVAARYRVFAEGAPENKVFSFSSWPIDKTLTPDPHDIYVNAQGLLMIHKPKPEQEMSLKAGDDEFDVMPLTGSAEPMRFIFSSMDGEVQIYGTLVPHPVVSYDEGCRIEVRIAQPDATAVLIIVDGFPAKAKIPLVLESEGARDSEVMTTNLDGHAVMASFPYVPGKTQGMLKATAEGPKCLPSVVLPWGAAAPSAPKTP
jgi:hypothetical protein